MKYKSTYKQILFILFMIIIAASITCRGANSSATFEVNGVSFNMIAVQGGTFTMGATAEQGDEYDDDELPAHQVTLSTFYIGQTEVTQQLWVAVMGTNPSHFKGGQRPVESVTWDDCLQFITNLNQITGKNFRLPTEAEWEYATRGGSKSRGYKYPGSNTLDDVAWYNRNSNNTTHAVGTKQPNELGIYDMSGNVSEWLQDWYGNYSNEALNNPTGPTTGTYRVNSDGCWFSIPWDCRVSNRTGALPSYRSSGLGLRLALDSGSITTDIEQLPLDESDPNLPIEVYDLRGVKVADSLDNLPAGTYILRRGSRSTKVVK